MLAFLMQYKISLLEASKTPVISYKIVFYMAKKLRGSIYAWKIVQKPNGTVEMDELYLTAGLKGKEWRGDIRGGAWCRQTDPPPPLRAEADRYWRSQARSGWHPLSALPIPPHHPVTISPACR